MLKNHEKLTFLWSTLSFIHLLTLYLLSTAQYHGNQLMGLCINKNKLCNQKWVNIRYFPSFVTLNLAGLLGGFFFFPVPAPFLLRLYWDFRPKQAGHNFQIKIASLFLKQIQTDFFFSEIVGLGKFFVCWIWSPDFPFHESCVPMTSQLSWEFHLGGVSEGKHVCLLIWETHQGTWDITRTSLSTKLRVARNKTKRVTKRIKLVLWEEVAS